MHQYFIEPPYIANTMYLRWESFALTKVALAMEPIEGKVFYATTLQEKLPLAKENLVDKSPNPIVKVNHDRNECDRSRSFSLATIKISVVIVPF